MPRRPRLELAGTPLPITQRGVNRAAVFIDDADRSHYLDLLRLTLPKFAVSLHAYVLMGNHVHLLASAAEAGAISQVLRNFGQCYAQAFNRRHRRTSTLWEGRFKSCLVDSDRYLLTVCRYIELNLVRAAMTATPEEYRWSSVHANLATRIDPLVTPHPVFQSLGNDRKSRATGDRARLYQAIGADEWQAIRSHLQQERALGDPRFQAMVEKALNRPACVRPRGRPARTYGIETA